MNPPRPHPLPFTFSCSILLMVTENIMYAKGVDTTTPYICVHPPFAPFKRDYNPLLHPYKSKGGCTPPLNFIITFFMSHTHLKITLLILGLEGCKNFLVSFVHPSGENLCTPLMPDERKLFSPP